MIHLLSVKKKKIIHIFTVRFCTIFFIKIVRNLKLFPNKQLSVFALKFQQFITNFEVNAVIVKKEVKIEQILQWVGAVMYRRDS